MIGRELLLSPSSVRASGRGSSKLDLYSQTAPVLPPDQGEEALVVTSFTRLSDCAALFKPVQCVTNLVRHCISAFTSERLEDRKFWHSCKRSSRPKASRHVRGANGRRSTSVVLEGIFPAGCCTSIFSSDDLHHEVVFRWLKVGENAFKEDPSSLGLDSEPAIVLPMVCFEGAAARPSHKTLKGWEIIKPGMDYVLGRSIFPATNQKASNLINPLVKDTIITTENVSQCQRRSLDSIKGSAFSSADVQSTGTQCFDPRAQPAGQFFASAQESKTFAKHPTLFTHDAVAGALAGMCVSLCLHPLDTIKTVIQAQSSGQRSIFHTLLTIVSERGCFGLYRGLGSNLASSAPISAIYTFTYESVKAALLPHLPIDCHAIAHCTAGGCASIATSIVYTPSECVKQRMQVGNLYRNSWLTFLGILKNGGISVLYSGWVAVLCRNVPQSVIKFYTYEGLKHYALSGQPDGTPLSTFRTLVFGGMAGSTAALFTTPFDVIKTRLQTQTPGSLIQQKGIYQALQHIVSSEGIGGLYRGLIPRLVIYLSQGALFFATYEFFKQVLAMEVKKFAVLTCHSANVVGQGKVVEPT